MLANFLEQSISKGSVILIKDINAKLLERHHQQEKKPLIILSEIKRRLLPASNVNLDKLKSEEDAFMISLSK